MSIGTAGSVHATFTLERDFPHPPAQVFRGFSDGRIKRRWFAEGEGFTVDEYALDFREGGAEFCRFRTADGQVGRNRATYLDIVTDQRIVLAYAMDFNGARISCSLLTLEFAAMPAGTRLTLTEQGCYLPNSDGPSGREEGTRQLLEALAAELGTTP